jgi:hypothetical protein
LPDGSRLVSAAAYQELLQRASEDELKHQRIYPIHPAFRIIALGDLPTEKHPYINTEVSCLFNFHRLRELPDVELSMLLSRAVPHASKQAIHKLVAFSSQVRRHHETAKGRFL